MLRVRKAQEIPLAVMPDHWMQTGHNQLRHLHDAHRFTEEILSEYGGDGTSIFVVYGEAKWGGDSAVISVSSA